MPNVAETQGLLSRAFLCGLVTYVVLCPFYREYSLQSSWWDAAAARRVSALLRVAILLEVARNGWLLYNVISAGDPTQGHEKNLHYYWTFGMCFCVVLFIICSPKALTYFRLLQTGSWYTVDGFLWEFGRNACRVPRRMCGQRSGSGCL
jgi:hypothetical protein